VFKGSSGLTPPIQMHQWAECSVMQIPDVSTPARYAAVGVENLIRHNPVETGVFIGPDGATHLKRKGWNNRVSFTRQELKCVKGATFTHNHPNGYGPSLDDVHLGAAYGLKEVRVVTANFRHGLSMLNAVYIVSLSRAFAVETSAALIAVQDVVRRARARGIPVVQITETLVPPGATFQEWQTAQLQALLQALTQSA